MRSNMLLQVGTKRGSRREPPRKHTRAPHENTMLPLLLVCAPRAEPPRTAVGGHRPSTRTRPLPHADRSGFGAAHVCA